MTCAVSFIKKLSNSQDFPDAATLYELWKFPVCVPGKFPGSFDTSVDLLSFSMDSYLSLRSAINSCLVWYAQQTRKL